MEPLADRTKALADRLRANTLGALELYTVYLGERLGLYRALADGEPVTSSELAERTGTLERYVREWLEQHAASGLLDVDDPATEPLAPNRRRGSPTSPAAPAGRASRWLVRIPRSRCTGSTSTST
jgi:hypothetical protein